MLRGSLPAVPGVLTAEQSLQTARAIADMQEPSGAIPWFPGGHTDPWDHIESAMALTACGLTDESERAFRWLRRIQRADGSWPIKLREGVVEDANSDSNFCAYLAVGVWHHYLLCDDRAFVVELWPTICKAIDFVLTMQGAGGEFAWGCGPGGPVREALLTGNSSIHHSLRCALMLAELMGDHQPDWDVALFQLGHALRRHLEVFAPKPEYSMDWYYPVLGGALRGEAARNRIRARWDDFVVPGVGARCVEHRPWVTGAETCELVLALDAVGMGEQALSLFGDIQHLRDSDGAYWTGLVFSDGVRWPAEQSSWTSAAVILAADALSCCTAGSGIFRYAALPAAQLGSDSCGEHCYVSGSPV